MRARRYLSLALAGVLALGVCSCTKELQEPSVPEEVTPTDGNGPKVMVVKAGSPQTKTIVEKVDGHYVSKWVSGDQIRLVEAIYENYGKGGVGEPVVYYTSDPLPGDPKDPTSTVYYGIATFSVTLGVHPKPEGAQYRYIGVYPPSAVTGVRWTEEDGEWSSRWGEALGEDHITLELEMTNHQIPSPECFDTRADVMVSEMTSSATQPTELTLNYARVGTVVGITMKGLPANAVLDHGRFSFGDSWHGAYRMEYDPLLRKRGVFSKSTGFIDYTPAGISADESGQAVIWLRTLSGTLNDWFDINVYVTDDGGGKKGGGSLLKYEKHVDLAKAGKSIVFAEGGVTTFGVVLAPGYDVIPSMVSSSAIEETGATLNLNYNLGGKPYETAVYGVLVSADASHVESIAQALPEEIYPVGEPDGEGNVSVNLTGLTAGTDYYVMPYVTLDEDTYYTSMAGSFSTLAHIDYATPELVDLGLPSGTKWASFNLGSTAPELPGRYFAWGETYPRESFSAANKYWTAYNNATKYSTSAMHGELVDKLTVLEASDDAASVNLGGSWRTPTWQDFQELLDNTNAVADNVNEKAVIRYTSKVNGHAIVLPCCKYYDGSNSSLQDQNYYMSASLSATTPSSIGQWEGFFNGMWLLNAGGSPALQKYEYTARKYGLNIRPVNGGSRQGLTYTCFPSTPVKMSETSVCIGGSFTNVEDGTSTYYYYAVLYVAGNTSYYQRSTIERNGSHTFTGLTGGNTYYYSVGWYNKNTGESQESEIQAFTL